MQSIFLILIVIFFAVNMGASGVAPSFASTYGAQLIKKRKALLLFSLFVILGAVCLGRNVSITLGKSLLPAGLIDLKVTLVILGASAISLFLANILKIPQSTSQVTVASIIGAGLYLQNLHWKVFLVKILPMWFIFPGLSFVLTFVLYNNIYPPDHDNLHIYEKVFSHHNKLKASALIMSCYVAFAIGTNNVANAVGPLYGAGFVNILSGLVLVAPLFGVGAWLIGSGPLETVGKEIVPLGLISSTLVSFVTATLLIIASLFGVPQSLVQLNLCSIFAISCVKNGHKFTLSQYIARKTFIVWVISPLLAVFISYTLLTLWK